MIEYKIGNNISYILPYRVSKSEQLYNVVREVEHTLKTNYNQLEKQINKVLGWYK